MKITGPVTGKTFTPPFEDGLIMKIVALLLKQTELLFYVIIYKDIIKHDKSMAPLIGSALVKGRIRRSAVTLTALNAATGKSNKFVNSSQSCLLKS